MVPPYRKPAERPPEPPVPAPALVVAPDAEVERDDPSTMWVSDAKAREVDARERQKRLVMSLVAGAVIVVVTVLFTLIPR